MRLMALSTKLLDHPNTEGGGRGDRAGELRECVQGLSPCLTFTTLIPPPPRVVSPLDLWSCALPRWQFNVNVNVSHFERPELLFKCGRIHYYVLCVFT